LAGAQPFESGATSSEATSFQREDYQQSDQIQRKPFATRKTTIGVTAHPQSFDESILAIGDLQKYRSLLFSKIWN
jgi:hypothetical protein